MSAEPRPLWYQRVRRSRVGLSLVPQVRREARTHIYKHLAAAIKLGVPVQDSLLSFGLNQETWFRHRDSTERLYRQLEASDPRRWFQKLVGLRYLESYNQASVLARNLSVSLLNGCSLSESLSKESLDFPAEDIALIALAEQNGKLPEVMVALAKSSGEQAVEPAFVWQVLITYGTIAFLVISFIKIAIEYKLLSISKMAGVEYHGNLLYSLFEVLTAMMPIAGVVAALWFCRFSSLLGQICILLFSLGLIWLVTPGFRVWNLRWSPLMVWPTTSLMVLAVIFIRGYLQRPTQVPAVGGYAVRYGLRHLFRRRAHGELRIMELMGVAARTNIPEHDAVLLLAQCYPAPYRQPLLVAADKVGSGVPLGQALAGAGVLTGVRARAAEALLPGPQFGPRLCALAHDLHRVQRAHRKQLDRVLRPATIMLIGCAAYFTVQPIIDFLSRLPVEANMP